MNMFEVAKELRRDKEELGRMYAVALSTLNRREDEIKSLKEQLDISKIPSGKEVTCNSLMNEIDKRDQTIKELREIIKAQNISKTVRTRDYIDINQKVRELAEAMGWECK